jgi:phage baseplate assembly protein V
MYQQVMELAEKVSELERRLSNQIITGKIIAVDDDSAKVRVKSGEIETGWRPWVTTRAGDDQSWWAPSVGEQVLLLSPSGLIENSIVLPSIFQNAIPPGQTSDQIAALAFSDGTIIEYDKTAKILTVNVAPASAKLHLIAAGDISIQSGGTLALQGATVTIDGPVTQVGGDMTSDGTSAQTHTHTDTAGTGAGTTSGPN